MARPRPTLKGRKSSKPITWSAWPCVSSTASICSIPTRSACERKSGVVSITTCCPFRERRTEVRMRLSRGSLEVHTAQRQPMVGTPMEVPEPRTVRRNLPVYNGVVCDEFADIFPVLRLHSRCDRPTISLAFCFCRLPGLRCLGGQRLVHFHVSHLQFSQKVQQQRVFFRSEIAFGLFPHRIQHINQFAGCVRINHRLARSWIRIAAQHHGAVASQHAD